MRTITSTADLKKTIQLLEDEHAANGKLLIAQFQATYETFKPVNLLRSALQNITASPNLIDNILGTSLGLATRLVSNLLFKGLAGPGLGKVISPVLQLGVTSLVSQHGGSLRSMGEIALLRIFRNKRVKLTDRVE
ncbi:MAG: hypothetical protein U5L72_07680 [Bacteroidales bacterium]|nr:hypothetical protein [Bacteroidales bacterium]